MARAFSRCRGVLNLTAFLQAYCLHGSANGYALCEKTSYRGRGESGVVTGLDRLVQVFIQAARHGRCSVRRGRRQNRFRLNAAIQQLNLVLHIQVHRQIHHRLVLLIEQLNARIRSLQLLQNLSSELAQRRRVIELLVLQITTDNRGKPSLPLRSVVCANRTVLEMEGINCVPERFGRLLLLLRNALGQV